MQLIKNRLKAGTLICAITLASFASASYAFSDDEARKAILELRSQVKQMNEQNQQARLQLADQIDQLHQEVTILRGRLEELSHKSLPTVEDKNAPKASGNLDPQERAVYEQAADLYRNGRYKEAATGFNDFIDSYPDSSIIGDANFYLGSSLYASKDFKKSIDVLQNFIESEPKSSKAPDALLVIAADNIELNNIDAAKANMEKIINDYPKSKAAETAKNRLELL